MMGTTILDCGWRARLNKVASEPCFQRSKGKYAIEV